MAKLTPTELKVLATEAEQRIQNVVEQKNEAIRNSPAYLNFDEEFKHSALGAGLIQHLDLAKELDEMIAQLEIQRYRYNNYDLAERVNIVITNITSTLKARKFPTVTVPDQALMRTGNNGYRFSTSLYDHFLHQLSLKQLTTDADLAKLLDELVKEFIEKL
jgi:transcriptional regulator of met regulon